MNNFLPQQVFRYCPRCGSDQFLPDSQKSMKCDKCGFQFYFNMVAAVAGLIYDQQGKLLMTYRAHDPAKGKLDLPGGFVDQGEDAIIALRREIMEELNLVLSHTSYYATFPNEYLYGGITYYTLDIVFNCQVQSFEGIKPADDVSGYTFIDPFTISPDKIGLSSVRNIMNSLDEKGITK